MTVNNGDILKVVFELVLADGTITQNVYHYFASLAAPQADLSVVNAIESQIEDIYADFAAYISSSATQNLCTVDKVEWVDTKWEVVENVGTFTPTITYTGSGDTFPNQVAPVAVLGTTRPKSKGRKFLMATPESAALGSLLVSAALTALANYAAEVIETITLGPLNLLLPGIVRTDVNSFLQFTYAVVTNVLGTMRTRKPGIGV